MRRARASLAALVVAVMTTFLAGPSLTGASIELHNVSWEADSDAARTCVYTRTGTRLGCFPETYECGLGFSTAGHRHFLTEDLAEKDLDFGEPDTAAERVRPGVWRIVTWPKRQLLGRAVTTNAEKTHWRITNGRGALVATARGPDGPRGAMVILSRRGGYFCG